MSKRRLKLLSGMRLLVDKCIYECQDKLTAKVMPNTITEKLEDLSEEFFYNPYDYNPYDYVRHIYNTVKEQIHWKH
jgi:hypothetical protein